MRILPIYIALATTFAGCNGSEEALRQQQAAQRLDRVERAVRKYDTTYSHVISSPAEYYTTGPQQGRPPDGSFAEGTKVQVLEDAGNHVLVRSQDGIEAYVAAEVVVRPEGIGGDLFGAVEASNRVALDLYQQLRSQEGNLFFSPTSITTALAMTYAGAAGATEAEMAEALHFTMPEDRLHQGMATLQAYLDAPSDEKGIRLHQANRLWGQESYAFLPAFLETTRKHYGAELAELSFANSEQARETINDWVEEQTQNKITDLMPAGSISSDTRLVLTNAVYFHGVWADPFNKDRTRDENFHLTPSETIQVPMMHRQGPFRYANVDDLQLLELPYGDGSLSMVVLLPKRIDGLATLEQELTFQNLQRWLARLTHEDEVRVYLPRFRTTSQFQLATALAALGMESAFDPDSANFSDMARGDDLFISAVVHKAFVDVNEEGTEAAAATGAVVGVTAAPAEPKEPPLFRADHPFVFLIQDNRNGAVLFLGRITNPLR